MSTTTFKKAITDLTTKKVILTTVTLSYDGVTTGGEWPLGDLHLVDNTTSITSTISGSSLVYQPYGLTFTAPSTASDGEPTAKILIDDIDQVISANFRSVKSKANATIHVIIADNPNQIEIGPLNFVVNKVDISGSNVTLSLNIDSVLRNALTGFNTDANYFPGLFL